MSKITGLARSTINRGRADLGAEPLAAWDRPGVSALIGCPISVKAAASFSMLFDTHIKALPNGVLVDHATDLRLFAAHWNPQDPSHSAA